jgi:hypothetical protein
VSEALARQPARDVRPHRAALGALILNLRAALAAALFRRVGAEALVLRPAQLLALVLLCLAVEFAFEVAAAGSGGSVDWQALPRALFHVPLALLAGLFLAWRRDDASQLLRTALLFAGIRFWYGFAFGGLDLLAARGVLATQGGYDRWVDQAWYVIYALWLLAMLRAVVSEGRGGKAVRMGQAAVAVAILAAPLWLLPAANLWRVEPDDEAPARDWFAATREEVIYAQPALLARQLERLAPHRPGTTDLYFVGVAGYAAEDVFMKEVAVFDALFRERFGTQGRSVTLVNNPQTVARLPVASSTSLARTLEHVGRIMSREDDVLFLYLTSHGSEDHRFALQFWPLQLNDIEPQALRAMLDRAGIKWRVIAISACYAGGFIDALRDEHTLVLTAADARHQSFGCGTESDFTYFGHAYDEALRHTWSFTEAFERARARIAAREQAESLTPSNPQMFLGSRMAGKLAALAASLRTAHR